MSDAESVWECPRCKGSPRTPNKEHIHNPAIPTCLGLVCECREDASVIAAHENLADSSCPNAYCYCCGWSGVFPPPPESRLETALGPGDLLTDGQIVELLRADAAPALSKSALHSLLNEVRKSRMIMDAARESIEAFRELESDILAIFPTKF